MSDLLSTVSSSRHARPLRVAIEGNIGSGKSTFLTYCQQYTNVDVAFEPIEEWTNVNGSNLLAMFYQNPAKWSLTFQSYVNLTMVKLSSRPSEENICLTERSLLSSRNCFTKAMHVNGHLAPAMYSVLESWYDFLESNHRDALPHAIVYLNVSPDVAYERMLVRSRNEESSVTLAYLELLDNLYSVWLHQVQTANMNEDADLPVFTIDANQPKEALVAQYQECMQNLELLLL